MIGCLRDYTSAAVAAAALVVGTVADLLMDFSDWLRGTPAAASTSPSATTLEAKP